MKTLYQRIVAITFLVMIVSIGVAFLISNVYYQYHLKPINDQKLTYVAKDIQQFYNENPTLNQESYFNHISQLGYEIYQFKPDGTDIEYGDSFRKKTLEKEVIQSVLDGTIYHGIANFPKSIFITGFFDNDLRNTIGFPIENSEQTSAVFIRSDPTKQFGELRIFLVMLLVFSVLIGFILIFLSSYFIVSPIKRLTTVTKEITDGQSVEIHPTKRKDEIGQLTNSFATMTTELNKSEKARQEFVANVSHEIQTPLTSIQGFTSILKDEKLSLEQRENYLTIIETETSRLSSLTKQLLTLAYLDNENQLIQKQSVAIHQQIKHYLKLMQWKWQEKDLYIVTELPPTFVLGNENFLYQIWQNLITNAIRYAPQGGEITITLSDEADQTLLTIYNNGPGIDPEKLPYLFDRFYRVDENRSNADGGSGLGLAITKKIIQLHGGTISVSSSEKTGTTFTITFPK
ncbi:two-component sensor histidine kinase [Carnobacterium divergens]|uniref:sensor histidine kinase n=1 Tax=Carnobacterium divergens TaxID=2748 RepID=UPI00107266B0|nr:HAMP domain-containing sensor histidine kinase [Carnobacterium divergens]MDT1995332.1 HAMP domain-containing histidine kinase [Carnobacterium divergens]TFI65434.1 two-component sensor histidine kinase [Carnobacterium divergens]TFI65506.1 two-component sensor histidine kinase [Carnobacterium divergens]TFI68928.1 two-component sensor histidine kinase [Carnobacterium divergens]TFI80412.1 two-component sensor histidine kinase [Carnobacterium divergens]